MSFGAPTIVTGSKATANLATLRVIEDFAKGIAIIDAFENPKLAVSMNIGRGENVGAIKHSWYETELMPETDQINFSTGYSSSATALTVDHGDRFTVGDVWVYLGLNSAATIGEQLFVIAKSSNVVQFTRDFGQSATSYTALAGSLVDNGYLRKIGNVFKEMHPIPGIASTKEEQRDNYCGDIRTAYGASDIAMNSNVRGEAVWSHEAKKAALQHNYKMNRIFWYGKPNPGDGTLYDASTGNSDAAASAGIKHYIDEYAPSANSVYQDQITFREFSDFITNAFYYGSMEKSFYVCSKMLQAIEHWKRSTLMTTVNEKVFGINVQQWISMGRTLNIFYDKSLDHPSGTGGMAFVVDEPKCKLCFFNNIGATHIETLDVKSADGSTGKKEYLRSVFTYEIKEAPCHAYLDGLTDFSD